MSTRGSSRLVVSSSDSLSDDDKTLNITRREQGRAEFWEKDSPPLPHITDSFEISDDDAPLTPNRLDAGHREFFTKDKPPPTRRSWKRKSTSAPTEVPKASQHPPRPELDTDDAEANSTKGGSSFEILQSTPIVRNREKKNQQDFGGLTPISSTNPIPADIRTVPKGKSRQSLSSETRKSEKQIPVIPSSLSSQRTFSKKKSFTDRVMKDLSPDTSNEQSPVVQPQPVVRSISRGSSSQRQLSQDMNPSQLYGTVIQSSSVGSAIASSGLSRHSSMSSRFHSRPSSSLAAAGSQEVNQTNRQSTDALASDSLMPPPPSRPGTSASRDESTGRKAASQNTPRQPSPPAPDSTHTLSPAIPPDFPEAPSPPASPDAAPNRLSKPKTLPAATLRQPSPPFPSPNPPTKRQLILPRSPSPEVQPSPSRRTATMSPQIPPRSPSPDPPKRRAPSRSKFILQRTPSPETEPVPMPRGTRIMRPIIPRRAQNPGIQSRPRRGARRTRSPSVPISPLERSPPDAETQPIPTRGTRTVSPLVLPRSPSSSPEPQPRASRRSRRVSPSATVPAPQRSPDIQAKRIRRPRTVTPPGEVEPSPPRATRRSHTKSPPIPPDSPQEISPTPPKLKSKPSKVPRRRPKITMPKRVTRKSQGTRQVKSPDPPKRTPQRISRRGSGFDGEGTLPPPIQTLNQRVESPVPIPNSEKQPTPPRRRQVSPEKRPTPHPPRVLSAANGSNVSRKHGLSSPDRNTVDRPKKPRKEDLFGNQNLIPRKIMSNHLLFSNKDMTSQEFGQLHQAFNQYAEKFFDRLSEKASHPNGIFTFRELQEALQVEGLIGKGNMELLDHFQDAFTAEQYRKVQGLLIPFTGDTDTFFN